MLQDIYFEGERVFLKVKIDTIGEVGKVSLQQPANYSTVIALWRNGNYASDELAQTVHLHSESPAITFEWDNPDTKGYMDLEVQASPTSLNVGDYRGFVDLGVT